jgi:hypothetical protein
LVDAGAERIDGYGDGHVDDLELVNGLHAEVGEGEDAGDPDTALKTLQEQWGSLEREHLPARNPIITVSD